VAAGSSSGMSITYKGMNMFSRPVHTDEEAATFKSCTYLARGSGELELIAGLGIAKVVGADTLLGRVLRSIHRVRS
jgi:hypothetical protein